MAVLKDILNNLEDCKEPLAKRVKFADNAFKSFIPIHHKEAGLVKWAINSLSITDSSVWILLEKWFSSNQFRNLVPNDISNSDVAAIIEMFLQKLKEVNLEDYELKKILQHLTILLAQHRVFKQYFKYNLKLYNQFIASVGEKIDCPALFNDLIQNANVFPKQFLLENKFSKYFLDYMFPVIVNYLIKYEHHKAIFDDVTKIVQKIIFQGKFQIFQTFFDCCLEGKETDQRTCSQYMFKYLSSVYSHHPESLNLNLKLLFHSFIHSYDDFSLSYKFLVCLMHFLNFNMSSDFNITHIKSASSIHLSSSLEYLVTLLDIVNVHGFKECTVSSISFTDFLRKLIKSLILLGSPAETIYEIIFKSISINPLTVEPLVTEVIIFLTMADNEKHIEMYEKVIIAIFEVFSKLHRIENFIAKMIQSLKSFLVENVKHEEESDLYIFNGENNSGVTEKVPVSSKKIFTENILGCFTNCINGLASWQVINLMKTFLYHLKCAVIDYVSSTIVNDSSQLVFLEILSLLTCQLLHSVRMADHTIPENVVTKFINALIELRDILKEFGPALLQREHNHVTMQTFLGMAYSYGEVYMTLAYYSINNDVKLIMVLDNTYSASNLMYLHSYLDIAQWHLISQRITNFGEYPCKCFLQKLIVQKLRGMLLFEKDVNDDIVTNVINRLQTYLEDTWKDLLLDKFSVHFIIPKLEVDSLIFLTERIIEDENLRELSHIRDSMPLQNAIIYTILTKINKNLKSKRKLDQDQIVRLSSKVFSLIPKETFFTENQDTLISELVEYVKKLSNESSPTGGKKTGKILNYLNFLKDVPVIFSNVNIQKVVFLYVYFLHRDFYGASEEVKTVCESLIIGLLQSNKFLITDLFQIDSLSNEVFEHFEKHNILFSLIVDNVFKNEDSIRNFEPCISYLTKNLSSPKHMTAAFTVLQAINKHKKAKMEQNTKETANNYKEKIISKMCKLACKTDYLIEAYGTCLKHYLSVENDQETLKKLTDKLAHYIEYSLENINNENKRGCVVLFATVLHNKQKLSDVKDDLVLKIWNACKNVDIEEYSQLINLIVTLIPNEEFQVLVKDLYENTEKHITEKNCGLVLRQIKICESILNCNINPVKMKMWQSELENLVERLSDIFTYDKPDVALLKEVVHLKENIIVTSHFMLSPMLIDLFLTTVTDLMELQIDDFELLFNLSVSLLEKLLKHRNAIIMDRLPPFLQQFRIVLRLLCEKSNSDELETSLDMKKAEDCAHKLEKFIKNLVLCKKDMSRISVFLIADILDQYERINLFPNVKLHLNNSVYSLVSLCDHHAVSYLMRVLSSASTEMFKILYEHYKKYYMFTGKV